MNALDAEVSVYVYGYLAREGRLLHLTLIASPATSETELRRAAICAEELVKRLVILSNLGEGPGKFRAYRRFCAATAASYARAPSASSWK